MEKKLELIGLEPYIKCLALNGEYMSLIMLEESLMGWVHGRGLRDYKKTLNIGNIFQEIKQTLKNEEVTMNIKWQKKQQNFKIEIVNYNEKPKLVLADAEKDSIMDTLMLLEKNLILYNLKNQLKEKSSKNIGLEIGGTKSYAYWIHLQDQYIIEKQRFPKILLLSYPYISKYLINGNSIVLKYNKIKTEKSYLGDIVTVTKIMPNYVISSPHNEKFLETQGSNLEVTFEKLNQNLEREYIRVRKQ